MLEIVQELEQTAGNLDPPILIGVGVVTVIVGLFVWLGGLGLRRYLTAVLGLLAGGIVAFFLTDHNIIAAGASAAVCAVIALAFEKIFVTALAVVLAMVCVFAALAGLLHKADLNTGLMHACSQMPVYTWAIIASTAVILIIAAVYLWRFTSALCCAAFGTILVFAGMILLLVHKGATPMSSICTSTPLYIAVFGAMTAFGTTEQLLLYKPPRKQPTKKKETDNESSDETRVNWRTQ
ncbi:MAG: hypothetical protein ACYS83_06990 [Planctomycetota bacterium]|jgi:hypothetical protein